MIPHDATDVALIQAPNVVVDYGAELLDQNDLLVADLTEYLSDAPEFKHENDAPIPGDCVVSILSEPYQGARVRLFQTLSADGLTRRYDQGVFVLSRPRREVGESPATYSVQGFDKMYLLQHEVGDTYVVAAGTNYLTAVADVIADSGYTGLPPLLDGTAGAKTLPAARVWCGTVGGNDTSWLKVVNDLLKDIGYTPLYADQVGIFRSKPDVVAASRASEWTLDLTDDDIDIVDRDRTYEVDEFDSYNYWTFIRDGLAFPPAEGSGVYTVDRSAGGVKHPKPVHLTAADQASLVQQGDAIVAEDTQKKTTWSITCGPLPILGHRDVMTLIDPELGTFKVAVVSYAPRLDGAPIPLKLEVV